MGERAGRVGLRLTADNIAAFKRIVVFPATGGKSVAAGRYDQREEDADSAIIRIANEQSLNGVYLAVVHGWLGVAEESVSFAASPAPQPVEVVF